MKSFKNESKAVDAPAKAQTTIAESLSEDDVFHGAYLILYRMV